MSKVSEKVNRAFYKDLKGHNEVVIEPRSILKDRKEPVRRHKDGKETK